MITLTCTEHTVIQVDIAHKNLFELVVARRELTFTPGDCVAIYTDANKSRPYSIASGSNDDELRFVIRKMDGGEVSPWLMARRPGDKIRITSPFGWFRPGQEIGAAPFVFLATGTGIAPFLSYLNTYDKPPVCCLYGVRHTTDAIGLETLLRFAPTHLAVSREKNALHHQGHITDLFHTLPLNKHTHYYCCGLESMVNDTTIILQKEGIYLKQIHREVFFHG
jgi:ferredoxin-NADP reductase